MPYRILVCFALATAVLGCHYSCATCYLGESFVNCTSCWQGNITAMQDPDAGQPTFFNYHRYTGTCNAETNSAVNGYGIALLVSALVITMFTRKRECFVFLSGMQNLAFVSFLTIGYVNPLSYALQGLQYLLVFSKAQVGRKWVDDGLKTSGFYNLQSYLNTTDYLSNILQLDVFLGVFALGMLVTVLLESLCLAKVENHNKRRFIRRTIKRCIVALKYFFYFTLAEQFMMGAVAIRWGSTYPGAAILMGFYLMLFTYFCVYCYYNPIKFFSTRISQFWNVAQKIVYGVLVAFPVNPLVLPLVMLACTITEIIYDLATKQLESRLLVERMAECTVLLTLLIYIGVEAQGTNEAASRGFAALAVAVIAIYSVVPLVELSTFLYYRYILKRVRNEGPRDAVMKGRMITEEMSINASNPIDNTKQMMLHEGQINENALDQIRLEEAHADNNRSEDIYKFEEDGTHTANDTREEREYVPATGKKLKEGEAAATVSKFNPQSNIMEMMNMTQKSPTRRRPPRDPNREAQLKLAYGIRDP